MLEDCIRISELHKQSSCLYPRTTYMTYVQLYICTRYIRIRLNYATPHHPPPPTTSQNISTTTHHNPPPPANTHQHPPSAKIYPAPPTTTATTTHFHQKNGLPPSKSQNIFTYCSFWHCFNSFFFFEMQYFCDGDFVR